MFEMFALLINLLILTISHAVVTCYLFSFYLHVWSSLTQRLLNAIFYITYSRICRGNLLREFAVAICRGNLPQEFAVAVYHENLPHDFAVGICHRNLPWIFAVRICCRNLPWKFAVAICRVFFVFVSKSFFCM